MTDVTTPFAGYYAQPPAKQDMTAVLTLVGLGIAIFTSTNIDDLFVLLGFFADQRFRTRDIVLGQFLGIAALYFASVLLSLTALVVPAAYIGLLGLAPIAIGLG